MLLSRVVTALRRQDWLTVCLELLIVVVGIFLGLQANDWAEEREDRREEQAALERLFLESRDTSASLERQLEYWSRLNGLRRNAVQFADSDLPIPENELPLKIGINTLGQFPPVVPVAVVYEELTSSGQFQLIRSHELRNQVAVFHANLSGHNQLLSSFREGTYDFFSLYQRHVIWDYNPEATGTDILLSTYDWDSLREDESFLFSIIGLLRNQLVAEEGLKVLQDQAQSLCLTLAERVGRECTPPGAS
jgi:hypothetical protein